MGKGAKKQVTTDEWRNGNVEERLEYGLVKVRKMILTLNRRHGHLCQMLARSLELVFSVKCKLVAVKCEKVI